MPAITFASRDELDILEALVHDNKQRVKTKEQLAGEADLLMEVEGERARRRQVELAGSRPSKGGPDLRENVPEGSDAGRARDKVGKALGVSGKTAERLAKVGKKIRGSLNLHRRHLNAGQRAAVAVEIEPMLAAEAKERQREQARRNQPQAQKVEILPPIETAKARDEAAALTGTSGRYVQDAKKVKEQAPELLARVRAGELSVHRACRGAALVGRCSLCEGSPILWVSFVTTRCCAGGATDGPLRISLPALRGSHPRGGGSLQVAPGSANSHRGFPVLLPSAPSVAR
ncbi:MAG: hypothetical protein U0797_12900 [Gemmataceae bacterium]